MAAVDLPTLSQDITSTGSYVHDCQQWIVSHDWLSIANLYNMPRNDFGVSGVIPLSMVGIWAAKTGFRKTIFSLAQSGSSPYQAIALSVQDMLTGLTGPPLDLANPDVNTMLAALVQGGVLSSGDASSLSSLQVRYPASRAEVLFGAGAVVTPLNVQQSLGF